MGKKIDIGGPKEMAKFMKTKGVSDTKKFLKLFDQFKDKDGSIDTAALQKIVTQCGGKP